MISVISKFDFRRSDVLQNINASKITCYMVVQLFRYANEDSRDFPYYHYYVYVMIKTVLVHQLYYCNYYPELLK